MATSKNRTTPVQWVVLVFLIAVVAVGMFLGKDDPDTPWGPIILGAFGLMGLVVRNIFKLPAEEESDGYGN